MKVANCEFHIYENDKVVETVFEDGVTLTAAPNLTREDIARAEALGYRARAKCSKDTDGDGDCGQSLCPECGDSAITWAMTKDHEYGHSFLAELLGLPHSPTLWAVAHNEKVGPIGDYEERAVLFFQRYGLEKLSGS